MPTRADAETQRQHELAIVAVASAGAVGVVGLIVWYSLESDVRALEWNQYQQQVESQNQMNRDRLGYSDFP